MKKIATIFSKVFEPIILLPIAFVLCSARVGVPILSSLFWLMIMIVPTMIYRFWMNKVHKIDWDIHDRKKRVKPLFLLVLFLGIMGFFIRVFEPRLLPFLMLSLIWVVGFLMVTTWVTKISGHTGGDALATGMMISWFGWAWWPVLLIVPLVGWSRVVRHDHTVLQVIAGALYSWILILILT